MTPAIFETDQRGQTVRNQAVNANGEQNAKDVTDRFLSSLDFEFSLKKIVEGKVQE